MAAAVDGDRLNLRPDGTERLWPGPVWVGDGHWVWRAAPGAGLARAAGDRQTWLHARWPCPAVTLIDEEWLVTEAPAGIAADHPERQPRPDEVPAALGAALRRLHELPPEECPFDRETEADAEIGDALAAGRLDPSRLPPPYDRYPPARLVELLGPAGRPAPKADQVVCHGWPVVANWFLEGGTLASVAGVHRLGRADRHLDLAVLYRSLHRHFGPDAVYGFLAGYGRDPDLVRLDRYILLAVLLDAIGPAPAPALPTSEPSPSPPAAEPSPPGRGRA